MTLQPAIADTTYFYLPRIQESSQQPEIDFVPTINLEIIGKIEENYQLIQPLLLNIEIDDDGTLVISDDIFLVYGNGENLSDTLNDYTNSLIEFYSLLENSSKKNGLDQDLFEYLQTYIASSK